MGNHDGAICAIRKLRTSVLDADWELDGYQAGLVHSARALDEEQAAWLGALPLTLEIPGQ